MLWCVCTFFPLTFIAESYVAKDNHILLECKLSGNPKPTVHWQKDNCLLTVGARETSSSKYSCVEGSEGIWQFCIHQPCKEDGGLYTCYAENEGGQMKISKFVDVSDYIQKQSNKNKIEKVIREDREEQEKKKPDVDDGTLTRKQKKKDNSMNLNVESKMKTMFMPAGNKAQLICYVSGFIEDVYWLRGEERITKNMRHKIYNINGAISLEIYDARPDDSGDYKCVVKNSKNSVDCSCQLIIYDDKLEKRPGTFLSAISGKFIEAD